MTDKINGQISAFIDDELMDEEGELLVRRLCNDETLRQTAARYTLIGDAVRGSLDEIQADLNGSIMRAIEHEPMPGVSPAAQASGRSWGRLAAGGAVAATVAVMAVLAIRPDAPLTQGPSVAQSLTGTGSGVVVPDNDQLDPLAVRGTPVMQAGTQAPAVMDRYLLQHSQYSRTTVRQGPMVYRSVAGDEAHQRRAEKIEQAQKDKPAP
ncbi:MAG: sigma-E factor negative regulatory protein [Gammaproteobacteria bacterium]